MFHDSHDNKGTSSRLLLALLLLLTVLASLTHNAMATIPPIARAWVFGPATVWTNGTTNGVFHPLSGAIDSSSLKFVRTSFELSENYSGNCKLRPALRYSDNGITWDTAEEYPTSASYVSATGVNYGSSFTDITAVATARAYVQFGVQVANVTAGGVELCSAAMRVEAQRL